MGNLCCGFGNYEMIQRQTLLREGNDFKKKTTYLGVLSKNEDIFLQLNVAATRIQWKTVNNGVKSGKLEEISLSRVGKICCYGDYELVLLAVNGQKLLELTAESSTVRDLWHETLEELCIANADKATEEDNKTLKEKVHQQEAKEKEKYWKDRSSELEQRKVEAEERKKKLGAVGMKYTAQAMAKR